MYNKHTYIHTYSIIYRPIGAVFLYAILMRQFAQVSSSWRFSLSLVADATPKLQCRQDGT